VEELEPHTPAIAATESAVPATTEEAPAEETAESEAVALPPGEAEAAGINPVPPAGTGTVIETATADDGREFYTITTPAGNVFYLIIDFARQTENVYFLDAVTERDLLALAEKTGGSESGGSVPDTEADDPEPTPTPQAVQEPEAQDGQTSNIIMIVVVIAVVGGAGFYFKIYRGKKGAAIQDEYEADEPDDPAADEYGADETDGDDSPPWDVDEDDGSDDPDYGADEDDDEAGDMEDESK
jgi:hypothetical protein